VVGSRMIKEGETSNLQVSKKKYDGVSKGDFVELAGSRRAIVQYIGPLQNKKNDTWFGCELEFPRGKNDGSLEGVEYFQCRPNFGVFVKRAKILKILLRANHPRIEKVYKRARNASVERTNRRKQKREARTKTAGKTFFDVEDFVNNGGDESPTKRHARNRARSPTSKKTTSSSKRTAGKKRKEKEVPKKRTPSNSLERTKKSKQKEDLERLTIKLKGLTQAGDYKKKKRTPDAAAEKIKSDQAEKSRNSIGLPHGLPQRNSILTDLPSEEDLGHTQPHYQNLESPAGSTTPRVGTSIVERELNQKTREQMLQPIPGFFSPAGDENYGRNFDWNSVNMKDLHGDGRRRSAPAGTLSSKFTPPSWPSQMSIQEDVVPDLPDPDNNPWDWNSNQVSSWLLDFEEVRQYATLFVDHDIAGEELLEMRPTDLKRLGITDEDDLDKILQYIEHLKRFSELSRVLGSGKGREVRGNSGSLRQLSLNRTMNFEGSESRIDWSNNASEKFQRKHLKNIDNDFLTQEMMRVGETTYDVALGRIEEMDLSTFLRNQQCVVMAAVSEPCDSVRQICLQGSRAEIVRARELLIKQGFLPKLDKEDWFDILEDALDSGDVLEITQLLGQGMYKELNDVELLQSATIGQDTTTQTSLALMMFLLERLPTLNLKDESGISLVSMFCGAEGRPPVPEIVRFLISENVDLLAEDEEGLTPLFHATMVGHIDIVDMLLSSGDLSVNAQTKMGDSALMFASGLRAERDESSEPNLDLMRHLIEKHSVNINHQNNDGVSALMVGVGFVGFGYGVAPIYVDADLSAVSTLLQSQADVNLTDAKGRTALHYASENGIEEVVKLLMENGADPKIVDSAGRTPLEIANGQSTASLMSAFGD